jgi:hypothetical protein
MQKDSIVSLVKAYGNVPEGEFGKIQQIMEKGAEVKFDSGVKIVVPLVNLEECEEVKTLPTTEKEIVQGQGKPDSNASVEILVMTALDSDAIEKEQARLVAHIERLKGQIASMGLEVKELGKIGPRALSTARRVFKMKLSDAAKIAEIKAACGNYARK